MSHLPRSLSLSNMKLDIVYRILFLVSVCAAQGKSVAINMIIIKYVSTYRDWSEIVWLPKISRFKINLAISFIRKKPRWNALFRL